VEWRKIFEEFEASGLSASAFCRREGISRAAFTRRQQVRGARPERDAFVALPLPVQASPPSLAPGEMELSLPGGVMLRWRP
jgi:hypothetical protein